MPFSKRNTSLKRVVVIVLVKGVLFLTNLRRFELSQKNRREMGIKTLMTMENLQSLYNGVT
jgi:hypothetical protein